MNKNLNKVFLPLLNKPMIYYTLEVFQNCNEIDEIIIVTQKSDFNKINKIKNQYNLTKIKKIVEGGKERQDSVYNGLISIKHAKNDDIIMVHNGSNPFVSENEIIDCIDVAKQYGAAALGFPLKDTIKKVKNDFVENTVDRSNVYQIQTPQAVKYYLFVKSFNNAKKKNLKVTDDVSLVEALGRKVRIVPCSYENIKITTPDDFSIAEGILMRRENMSSSFRIGFGMDSHRFSKNKNKKLVLGGYIVPNEIGLEANSDGDVILHSVFNAISSALGDRSLGFYADEMYKRGMTDSRRYLDIILNKLNQEKFKINNIAIMIQAAKPKLEHHTDEIKNSLSRILNLEKGRIGITYTSGNGLTAFAKGRGVGCTVFVSLSGAGSAFGSFMGKPGAR